jgi:hypothetical protein
MDFTPDAWPIDVAYLLDSINQFPCTASKLATIPLESACQPIAILFISSSDFAQNLASLVCFAMSGHSKPRYSNIVCGF